MPSPELSSPDPDREIAYRASYPSEPHWVQRRRRDRHGRGQLSTRISPHLPGWRTRRETFEDALVTVVRLMVEKVPQVNSIEFATQEVPPSDPAPWEDHSVLLARVFPRDRSRNLRDRIVVYRQPVLQRCEPRDLFPFLQYLLADRVSAILTVDPEDFFN